MARADRGSLKPEESVAGSSLLDSDRKTEQSSPRSHVALLGQGAQTPCQTPWPQESHQEASA